MWPMGVLFIIEMILNNYTFCIARIFIYFKEALLFNTYLLRNTFKLKLSNLKTLEQIKAPRTPGTILHVQNNRSLLFKGNLELVNYTNILKVKL